MRPSKIKLYIDKHVILGKKITTLESGTDKSDILSYILTASFWHNICKLVNGTKKIH